MEAKTMNRITKKSDLIPGKLYCCFTIEMDDDGNERDPLDGALVWYAADGNFYDANYPDTEGEPHNGYADFWVEQMGPINHDYAGR